MNCRETRQRFDERLDQRLPVTAQPAFDQHVASCADCRQQWEAYAAVWKAVARQVAPAPSFGFAERTLRRLNEPIHIPWRWPRRWRWAALAVVVVVLLAGGWMVRQHRYDAQLARVYSDVRQNDSFDDYDVIVSLDQLEKGGRL